MPLSLPFPLLHGFLDAERNFDALSIFLGLFDLSGSLWPTAAPITAGSEPAGWLLCNGQAVSRTTYARLFGAVGTTYGVGDGSTTFNVPDLRGRAPIGAGTGSGLSARALGATGGEENHRLTTAEMPSHAHQEIARFGGSGATNGLTLNTLNNAVFGSADNTGATGGDGSHNTMPPWLAVNWLIRTG